MVSVANVLNNLIYSPSGGISLSNPSFPSSFSHFLATGTIDLYTAPSNRRAAIFPSYGANGDGSPATVTSQPQFKSGGTYYPLAIQSSTTQNSLIASPSLQIILEPGEICSVTVGTTASALNYGFPILEFDSSSTFRTVKLLSLSSGNNTLYTCPANTKAFILDSNLAIGTTNGQINYYNASGGSLTVQAYIVNSGGSQGTTNSTSTAASVGTGAFQAFLTSSNLNAGDFIVINTSAATATQVAWVNILEGPA